MAIETALNFRATIGESPTWVADERALYWIDVKAPALHRYCPDHEFDAHLADDERHRRLRADRR